MEQYLCEHLKPHISPYHQHIQSNLVRMEVLYKISLSDAILFVPCCTGLVETKTLTKNTDYIVLPKVNIDRQISIIDYPKCKVVSLDAFLKIVVSKMTSDDVIDMMEMGTCNMDIQDRLAEMMEDVDRRMILASKDSKMTRKELKEVKREYDRIHGVFDRYCEFL
jgi:hypothetical protein